MTKVIFKPNYNYNDFFSAASKLELININRVRGGSAGEGWGFDQGTKILVNFPRVGRHTFIKVVKNLHPGVKYQIKGVLLKAGPRPAARGPVLIFHSFLSSGNSTHMNRPPSIRIGFGCAIWTTVNLNSFTNLTII